MGADLYINSLRDGRGAGDEGYFRDSYASSNLLSQFGLSWEQDVMPLVDEDFFLSVDKARQLLAELTSREGLFEKNLAHWPAERQRRYRDGYRRLRQFLSKAISLEEAIYCWL